jgi:hypothetical protein
MGNPRKKIRNLNGCKYRYLDVLKVPCIVCILHCPERVHPWVWHSYMPKAQGQTALQSEPPKRATLLLGLSPGYVYDVSRLQMYHTNVLFGAPDQGQTLDV